MNTKILLATLAIAAAASGVARADDADPSGQFAVQFESSRTRAEVAAEAARVPATRSQEPAGSRVQAALQSGTDAKAVRAEAVQALRSGKIPSGEASL